MAFTPKDWQNKPSEITPISAEALKDMETRLSDYTDESCRVGTCLAHEWQTVSWNSGGAIWPFVVPGSVDITVEGNPDWPDPDGGNYQWLVGCEFTLDVETTVRLNFVCHSIGMFNTTADVDFVIPTFADHLPTGSGTYWHTPAAILSSPQAEFQEGEEHLMGLTGFSIPLNLDQYVKLPAGTHQIGVEAKTGDGADWVVQSVPTEPEYYPPYLRVEVADSIPPFPEVTEE
jgi:hypothetical protein